MAALTKHEINSFNCQRLGHIGLTDTHSNSKQFDPWWWKCWLLWARPPAATLLNFLDFLHSLARVSCVQQMESGVFKTGYIFLFSSDFEQIIVRDLPRLRRCQAKDRPSPSWFLCKSFIVIVMLSNNALWRGVDDASENVLSSISDSEEALFETWRATQIYFILCEASSGLFSQRLSERFLLLSILCFWVFFVEPLT